MMMLLMEHAYTRIRDTASPFIERLRRFAFEPPLSHFACRAGFTPGITRAISDFLSRKPFERYRSLLALIL